VSNDVAFARETFQQDSVNIDLECLSGTIVDC